MVLSGSPPANFNLALYLNSKIRKPAESNNKNPNKVERAQVFNQPGFINSLDIVFSKIFHTNFHSELLKDTSLQSSPKSLLTKLTNNINEFLVSVLSALLEDPSKSRKLLSEQAHAYSQGYAGGLHNAINTHIAMAKIATQKLIEKGLKFNSIEFEKQFRGLLETNHHILSEMSNIHAVVLKLIENMSGVKSNQGQAYEFNETNFEIKKYDDKDYLLPTIDFLDRVIQATNDPNTILTTMDEDPNNPYGTIEKKESFNDAYVEKRIGCPVFKHKDASGQNIGEKFFKQMDEIIIKAMFPTKSEGGIILV